MERIIVLGDIHGRDCWKNIIENEVFDLIIFMGDYLDSRHPIPPQFQLDNLGEIIEYKKQNPEKVILLFGNHDFHYTKYAMGSNEYYSGFNSKFALRYQLMFENNTHLFQMCYSYGNTLFTHAGISNKFLENNNFPYKDIHVGDFLNDLFINKIEAFKFTGFDDYGDSPESSPIWIRPYSLVNDNKGTIMEHYRQIIGHNTAQYIDLTNKNYILIDTLGTTGEYLIINDDKIEIGKI